MGRYIYLGLLAAILAGGSANAAPQEMPLADTSATVGAIRFIGVTRLNPVKLMTVLKTQPGQPFDRQVLGGDLAAVEKLYHDQGYPLAHVTGDWKLGSDGVLTIPVDEGHIEKIVIKGAKRTRQWVILRQLDLKPGSVYNTGQVNADRRRLFGLGLFDSVTIAPVAGADPGTVVLNVDVRERETGSVAAALGYTSSSGLVGYAQWSDTNFMGLGHTLALSWQRGAYTSYSQYDNNGDPLYEARVRSGYDLAYITPSLLRRSLTLGVRAYDTATQQFFFFSQDLDPANIKNYEWRRGLCFTAAHELNRGLTLGVLGRTDMVDFRAAPEGAVPSPGEKITPTRVNSVRVSIARGPLSPLTEQANIPRNGFFLELGQSRANGSSGSLYQKYGATFTHYLPVTKKDMLAARVQLGGSGGNVPFAELFAVGGAQTVRAYSASKFLGTRMFVLNTEWRHELRRGLTATAFVDLGYAWARNMTMNLSDLRPGLGVGLRVGTSFGPIRLDYAFGRDGGRAHLTTGDTF